MYRHPVPCHPPEPHYPATPKRCNMKHNRPQTCEIHTTRRPIYTIDETLWKDMQSNDWKNVRRHTHTHIHTHIYICIYISTLCMLAQFNVLQVSKHMPTYVDTRLTPMTQREAFDRWLAILTLPPWRSHDGRLVAGWLLMRSNSSNKGTGIFWLCPVTLGCICNICTIQPASRRFPFDP
jgi:hypothetical protein